MPSDNAIEGGMRCESDAVAECVLWLDFSMREGFLSSMLMRMSSRDRYVYLLIAFQNIRNINHIYTRGKTSLGFLPITFVMSFNAKNLLD